VPSPRAQAHTGWHVASPMKELDVAPSNLNMVAPPELPGPAAFQFVFPCLSVVKAGEIVKSGTGALHVAVPSVIVLEKGGLSPAAFETTNVTVYVPPLPYWYATMGPSKRSLLLGSVFWPPKSQL